jgi:hypothetical protein
MNGGRAITGEASGNRVGPMGAKNRQFLARDQNWEQGVRVKTLVLQARP